MKRNEDANYVNPTSCLVTSSSGIEKMVMSRTSRRERVRKRSTERKREKVTRKENVKTERDEILFHVSSFAFILL